MSENKYFDTLNVHMRLWEQFVLAIEYREIKLIVLTIRGLIKLSNYV